ncbi:sigma-54-dependent Fis family transcriptional regulator [Pseudoalteromonas sp. J010]|uniref:sigma-54-dependent transcriptional regulator n=1 Tax=Pseudoalteromonas sp. J010 TaxID=998465 RepID=UPI000F6469AF|nr:sigma-54 dependent transcriptional regulator [Pseudoalteromonas sp. J010]RRS09732.1 sigma-54-dependent Fis family transcriptional regulator [Pseudoalteromonas sp. J010]
MSAKPLILLVEDNREVRLAARFVLEDLGLAVEEVENPVQALTFLEQRQPSLILLDMNFELDSTSGQEGLRFLRQQQQLGNTIPVVAMTAWSHTQLVVQAMQLGAADFLEKPWKNQRFEQVIRHQLQLSELSNKNQALQHALAGEKSTVLWQSNAMQQLMEQLEIMAPTDANILLTGENGVGKSLIAQWIHQHSTRAMQPFISVNMATIPDQLFESELFGHTKGAFTDAKSDRAGRFKLANLGTLFLDEIGTLPINQQSKLLRVLESREYEAVGSSKTEIADVRLISATNAKLEQQIAKAEFRQDLFYRINTFTIEIPPLRSRLEDIELLARHFIKSHGNRYGKSECSLTPMAIAQLKQYDWPGNTRELSHLLERAVLLSRTGEISTEQLQLSASSSLSLSSSATAPLPLITLEQAEQQLITQALANTSGNKQQAAELLGITKQALYRRLEKYGHN